MTKKLLQGENSGGKALQNWYREFWGRDNRLADELKQAMWECTGCRRCAVFCPFDLDMGLLVSVRRFSLLQEGLGPEMIAESGNAEVTKGEIIDVVRAIIYPECGHANHTVMQYFDA